MRTTLTIDDDIAGLLKRRSHELGQPFKQVVNSALRKGLSQESAAAPRRRVEVRPAPLGLRPGYDPDRMNLLYDELEVEAYIEKERKPAEREGGGCTRR